MQYHTSAGLQTDILHQNPYSRLQVLFQASLQEGMRSPYRFHNNLHPLYTRKAQMLHLLQQRADPLWYQALLTLLPPALHLRNTYCRSHPVYRPL